MGSFHFLVRRVGVLWLRDKGRRGRGGKGEEGGVGKVGTSVSGGG